MLKTFVLRDDIHCRQLYAFLRSNWLRMAQSGKPLGVMVAEHKARRSNPQNKKLWAVLHEIAEHAWVDGKQYSADAWHEHFKRQFIGVEELPGGATAGISTATLDVDAFSEYIERILHYATTQLGVVIE
ncbi:MAG: recombination protein NinB [Sulfuricaulis sp.]|nr:recombination protein NinB [Sulfuricaulis sp.]